MPRPLRAAPTLAWIVGTLPAAVAQDLARPFPPLDEPRSIDGSGNSPVDPTRGAAFEPFRRLFPNAYADGLHAPAGGTRASARHISNAVHAQDSSRPAASGISDLFWQWGQFLDHDLTEAPIESPHVEFPIRVPTGDPWFDPEGTGAMWIPLSRSFTVDVDGAQEQINALTSWIDGSQIYGSDAERAAALRTLDGTGRLRTSPGALLPYNTAGLHNAPSDDGEEFFLAGDIRANEQVGLTALHTIFVREHNFWASYIRREDTAWLLSLADGAAGDGGRGGGRNLTRAGYEGLRRGALTGDEIYELARAIVAAELQLITYREWLPLLLGDGAIDEVSTYDPSLDGTISNAFATGVFLLGHSMLSDELLRLDANGDVIAAGNLPLASAFFAPHAFEATGVDPLVRGLLVQTAQELDVFVTDGVRNLLFGPPGAGGADLPALNVQRGRDHGLPSYGAARVALGLGIADDFADITDDPEVLERLSLAARSPATLDLWTGGLAENDVPGALVGPTFHAILMEQFVALRDGDRLWHTRQLPEALLPLVESQTFTDVLVRTTGIERAECATPFRAGD